MDLRLRVVHTLNNQHLRLRLLFIAKMGYMSLIEFHTNYYMRQKFGVAIALCAQAFTIVKTDGFGTNQW